MSKAGDDAKDEGMGRADRNADAKWKAAADRAVYAIAHVQEFLTSEDVRVHVAKFYPGVDTHEQRALGWVMRRAADRGLIQKHAYKPYESPSRHSGTATVWRSLVYNDDGPGTLF